MFIAKTEPSYLSGKPLDGLLSLVTYFLRRPWAIKSPHLRAKLGLLLMHVFLPVSEQEGAERWSGSMPVDGPNRHLLETHIEAASFLAPSLLLLYGDVEKTGYAEKVNNRRNILCVLKHIWKLPSHRAAFRSIVGASSSENDPSENSVTRNFSRESETTEYFTRFANGLLNETNHLVASILETLQEIKKVQTQMQDMQAWGALPGTMKRFRIYRVFSS